jgi:hypothetical protein
MAVRTGIQADIGKHLPIPAITEDRGIGNTAIVVIGGSREAGNQRAGTEDIKKYGFKNEASPAVFRQ